MPSAMKPPTSARAATLRDHLRSACWGKSLPRLMELLATPDGRAQLHVAGHEDGSGRTKPLMWAIGSVWSEGVAAMLAAGADPDSSDGGSNPLLRALYMENVDIVTLLVDAGAKMDAVDSEGNNALHHGAPSRQNLLGALLPARARWPAFETPNKEGFTPLGRAAFANNEKSVEILIDQGAEVDFAMPSGRTALSWAVANRSTQALEMLIAKGADLHHEDKEASLPLMTALSYSLGVMVDVLLAAGADPRRETKWNKSAIDIANERIFRLGADAATTAVIERGRTLDLQESLRVELPPGRTSPAPRSL